MNARYTYPCENCGGTIPRGVTYLCHVLRRGAVVGKGPLRRMRVHLDCQAPWYHATDDDRCRNLRQLPARVPPEAEQISTFMRARLAVTGRSPGGSEFQIRLSAELSARVLHAKDPHMAEGALAEISNNITLALHALEASAGHRKMGKKTSHVFHELQLVSGYVPKTNHDLDPDELDHRSS